jgi:hypothetical protein
MCAADRDCPNACKGFPGKPRCAAASVAWLRSCTCE